MERLTNSGTKEAKSNVTIKEIMDKLAHYEDLEEQGKLTKMPCTVGDIVYALWEIPTPDRCVFYTAEVKEIQFGKYGNRKNIKYRLEPISYRGRILDFYSDDFDKRFFLTQEKAEATLKEMRGLGAIIEE